MKQVEKDIFEERVIKAWGSVIVDRELGKDHDANTPVTVINTTIPALDLANINDEDSDESENPDVRVEGTSGATSDSFRRSNTPNQGWGWNSNDPT